ncbi:no significant blast hit [Histoplasma capsulatum var. duboisii H88]|uniref:No significant blast hit n=1 Tax=Ajellomyces capsulatus (strain H88) TaxID=544711 RepID=A0A8A1LPY5_AJEC8|nr:no significant blast hit [Histoplasma capsulatum var. duboisii H88]
MRHRPAPPAIQRPKPLRGTQYLKLLMPAVAARIPDLDPAVQFRKAGVHELHRAQSVRAHPDAGAHGIELRRGLVDRVFARGILLAEADGEREARDACANNGDAEGRVEPRRHGHRWSRLMGP